ncbi:MAG: hypothetical protein ACJ76V_08575 [Thermoleophilaceae bacterium]
MTSERTDEAAGKAAEKADERDHAKEKIHELEEGDPPEKLEDWPDDAAKYETYGGPEGEHSYDEGPEAKLGPSSVRHHEDGDVSVEGEKVDNPEEFKGDPIPGGPTDPEAPDNREGSSSEGSDGAAQQQQ